MALVYVIYRCGHYVFGFPARGRKRGRYEVDEDCLRCRGYFAGYTHSSGSDERYERRGASRRWTWVVPPEVRGG